MHKQMEGAQRQALGVDVGGTHLRIGVVSEQAEVSHLKLVPQRDVLASDPMGNLARFIQAYVLHNGCSVVALGVGLPATMSRNRDIVLSAPNIEGLDGVNVRSELARQLNLPVFPEKDVNALLRFDLERFQLKDSEIVIACYAGTGLGNAISICGQILAGHTGSAGELGHIPVRGNLRLCGCGNRGCTETVAGGAYLAQLRSELFPETPISDLFTRHSQHPELEVFVRDLAMAITTEINILDPAHVILGGGIVDMPGFPRDALEAYIHQYARKPFPDSGLRIVYSKNDGSNGVIGAGLHALRAMEEFE